MTNRASGFIKFWRSMADTEDRIYNGPEPFCPRSARNDLLLRARWSDGPFTTDYGMDMLKRGEFVGALRFWARRWRWTKDRVARFLDRLEADGFLTRQRRGQHGTVYLINNYATYQDDVRHDATPDATSLRQPRDADATKTKKGKKERTLHTSDSLFEQAWSEYPKRSGSNPRLDAEKAWNARVDAGESADEMIAGVRRYKAYCEAKGIVGQEYVMQAKRFFGPSRQYAESWELPADKATANSEEARVLAFTAAQDAELARDAEWLEKRRAAL